MRITRVSPGGADAEMDRVADADAELVGQPRAEHRLVGGGRRPARQGREPERAAQGLEAVHGGALPPPTTPCSEFTNVAASTAGSSAIRSAFGVRASAGTSIVPSPSQPYRAGSVTSRTRLAEKATAATTAPIASAAVTTGVRARWMRRPTRCSTAMRSPTATGTGRLARMTGSVTTDGVVAGATSGSGAVSRAPRRAHEREQQGAQPPARRPRRAPAARR